MADRFPFRFLFMTLMVTVLFISGMVFYIYNSNRVTRENREKEVHVSELIGRITYLDEVLTMSARLAASTGNLQWENRYNQFVQPLDDAIKEGMAIYPHSLGTTAAGQTDEANIKLVEMETRAFEFIRQGKKEKGFALLFSDEYKKNKEIYADGMRKFTDGLWGLIKSDFQIQQSRTNWIMFVFSLILPFLILAWVVVIRALERWHQAMLESHSLLDNKVSQRTAELVQKNEDLQKEVARREKVEWSLVQSEKMSAVGQLAAGIAHEINNPLGIILGFSQSLKSQLSVDGSAKVGLEFIEKESIRCKDLVQKLLVFSRGSQTETMEENDVNMVIDEALTLVSPKCRVNNVELIKEFIPDLPKTLLNKNQISQVIINLCNNAIDAMENKGTIRVRSEKVFTGGREWIRIGVTDTGMGIPPENQDRLFEPFFTTKEVGKGTGLGLSLVYEIVQKHGGRIDVESQPHKGSTFIVSLPVQKIQLQKAA